MEEKFIENEWKVKRWKECLEELYKGKEEEIILENEEEFDTDGKGNSISRSEFDNTLNELRCNKVGGVGNVLAEWIKYCGENAK